MGLSNMLSKLFKKEGQDDSAQNQIKYKDFESIILPPEPRTKGILIYKTLNLGMGQTPFKNVSYIGENEAPLDDDTEEEMNLTEDIPEDLSGEEDQ